MYLRILKKGLKRKKTMNIILLLFVIICSMFAAASINNIIAVTGGIDHFFDISDVTDIALSMPAKSDLADRIRELPGVSEVRTENYIMVTGSKNFSRDGVKLDNFINPAFFISDDNMGTKYFDEDNNVITDVEKGCFYANSIMCSFKSKGIGSPSLLNSPLLFEYTNCIFLKYTVYSW